MYLYANMLIIPLYGVLKNREVIKIHKGYMLFFRLCHRKVCSKIKMQYKETLRHQIHLNKETWVLKDIGEYSFNTFKYSLFLTL